MSSKQGGKEAETMRDGASTGQSVIRDAETAFSRAEAYAQDERRLAVVDRTGLLDAGIQESLQRYTRLAADLLPRRSRS